MTDITGREPALAEGSDITGREPGLGKDALRKHAADTPIVSWDDPRIHWGNMRRIVLTLSTPVSYRHGFQGMDHPLVMVVHSVASRGVIQFSLSSYRGLFVNIEVIETITGPLTLDNPTTEVSLVRVGYEITLMGRTTELDLVNFPEGVVFPSHQVLPEEVRIGFRYAQPMTPSPYFSPLVD